MWHLLINAQDMNELKLEIVQWLSILEKNVRIDSNFRLMEFVEVVVARNDKAWCSVLMPLLANFTKKLIDEGRDPRANLCIISKVANVLEGEYFADVTVALLSEASCVCPVNYMHQIVKTCERIFFVTVSDYLFENKCIDLISRHCRATKTAMQVNFCLRFGVFSPPLGDVPVCPFIRCNG